MNGNAALKVRLLSYSTLLAIYQSMHLYVLCGVREQGSHLPMFD